VFLARQGDLADRPVALKITADLRGEPQTLARLQNTNIVPVYSVHRAGAFQAVCMPYFGPTTLADVIDGLRRIEALPTSGKHLLSTLQTRKSQTRDALNLRPGGGQPADDLRAEPVPAAD